MKDKAIPSTTTSDLGISSTDRQTAGSLNGTLPTGKYSYLCAFILLADASLQMEADDITVAGGSGTNRNQMWQMAIKILTGGLSKSLLHTNK